MAKHKKQNRSKDPKSSKQGGKPSFGSKPRHPAPRLSHSAETSSKADHKLPKDVYYLFGKHPVEAALKNKERDPIRLYGTSHAIEEIKDLLVHHPRLPIQEKTTEDINQMVQADSPHQGLVLETRRLPGRDIDKSCQLEADQKNMVLVLDQVTDPHNIGAILRSAAAFGAKAIVTMDRNSPQESGVLAKSASGALDLIPWVRVGNLSQAIDQLKDMGYWIVGLDGYADDHLADIDCGDNVALILGSEGKGMRDGVRKKCDYLAKLPISPRVESLNVSNAAAVALYQLGR